jgi:hypothetical protein
MYKRQLSRCSRKENLPGLLQPRALENHVKDPGREHSRRFSISVVGTLFIRVYPGSLKCIRSYKYRP